MTDEKKPFSFGTSFTADPQPTTTPKTVSSDSALDQILALKAPNTLTITCSAVESSEIYEQTRGLRQAGKLRIKYQDGDLTARRVKE